MDNMLGPGGPWGGDKRRSSTLFAEPPSATVSTHGRRATPAGRLLPHSDRQSGWVTGGAAALQRGEPRSAALGAVEGSREERRFSLSGDRQPALSGHRRHGDPRVDRKKMHSRGTGAEAEDDLPCTFLVTGSFICFFFQ